MDNILQPDQTFDFTKLMMVSPTSLSGGVYFIRILTKDQQPVYIQSPKCTTKQGIIKTNKKMHCDLVFKHENESFFGILGINRTVLSNKNYMNTKKNGLILYLTEDDIENSFTPITKS